MGIEKEQQELYSAIKELHKIKDILTERIKVNFISENRIYGVAQMPKEVTVMFLTRFKLYMNQHLESFPNETCKYNGQLVTEIISALEERVEIIKVYHEINELNKKMNLAREIGELEAKLKAKKKQYHSLGDITK